MSGRRGVVLALLAGVVLASPQSVRGGEGRTQGRGTLYGLPALSLADFNRLVVQENVPIFWANDEENPGVVDPAELSVLGVEEARSRFVEAGRFTKEFESAYRRMVERRRREAVRSELDQGCPILVETDLRTATESEKAFVRAIAEIARLIDALHLDQRGAGRWIKRLESLDPESRALFARNQGPWCEAPRTQNDAFCSALPEFPPHFWGVYPEDVAHEPRLCEELKALPQGEQLLAPFTVVREVGGEYAAVPYNDEYKSQMREIAGLLRKAAASIATEGEPALRRYLAAAARGFESNRWEDADDAWAAMNARNSKWYLRVAPDEVYWDLCRSKAGFHVSFALIDHGSLELQAKLEPLRDRMEQALARISDGAYQARGVKFAMPDFIRIILNAGDSKHALGATIGQSLPNWGRVAVEGRGRTVAMTNLFTDPESRRVAHLKAESLLTAETMAHYTDDPYPGLVNIVLHEAAHNLGPHSDYKVGGKNPEQVFGGGLASTLEELKAQTGAVYYIDMLRRAGVLSDEQAKNVYTYAVVWAFGHISTGMFDASGAPKPYSQLAAVQVGFLAEEGALTWHAANADARGMPLGAFLIDYEKMAQAIEKLMARVVKIKATGDASAAKSLVEPYVAGDKKRLIHGEEIEERILRYPKGSLLYAVLL